MITRRRRLGSETEHPNSSETDTPNQVLKGPSSVLLGSGNNFHQPSFFVVPAGESENHFQSVYSPPNVSFPDVKPKPDSTIMPLAGNASTYVLSTSNSSSRDRTREFLGIVDRLKSSPQNGITNSSQVIKRPDQNRQHHSEFARAAKELASDIHVTYARLEQLTELVKKQSIFDDSPGQVQDLTSTIKDDISILNRKIAQLQNFAKKQQDQKRSAIAHSANVVVSLQTKLAEMSTEFKQVLDVRTENMKKQQSRREQYVTRDPVVSDMPPTALRGGFGSSSSRGGGSVLLRDAGGLGSVAIEMDGVNERAPSGFQASAQLYADETESYLQSRADTVQTIESTVVELGSIFQQLALMVREQEESVQRIDSNVEDTYLNVEAAHDELLRYFRSVTSNRWLMFKVFGVIFVFIIIFAVFFA